MYGCFPYVREDGGLVMNDNLKIYNAQEIWSSVEYGNGMHKGDHNFVRLEDFPVCCSALDSKILLSLSNPIPYKIISIRVIP